MGICEPTDSPRWRSALEFAPTSIVRPIRTIQSGVNYIWQATVHSGAS